MILGGGGLFHDYWGFDPTALLTCDHAGLAFFGGVALLATLLGRPLMLYAVGVGPLLSEIGKAHTRAAFEQASVITVRDAESKKQLRALGITPKRIRVTADPAFRLQPEALDDEYADLIVSAKPLLGVALRNWTIGVLPAYWERQVAQALDNFLDQYPDGSIRFIPFQNLSDALLDDCAVAERVMGQMRNAERAIILPEDHSAGQKAALLARCDLVLGMRFHALIFAVRSGVPSVGLVYDPKVRSLMDQVGCATYALDLGAITAQKLGDFLSRAYLDRETLAQLRSAGAKMEDRAAENARLAVKLLKDEASPRQSVLPTGENLMQQTLLSHTQKLFAQRERLQALVNQAAARDQTNAESQVALERQVGERDRTITELQTAMETQVAERVRAINELKAALDEQVGKRDQLIAELRSALAQQASERDQAIAELQASLEEQVGERDRAIAELQSVLETQIAERDQMIGELQAEVQAQVGERDSLQQQARERDQIISDLQAQLHEREQEFLKIYHSRHWRVLLVYWTARNRLMAKWSGLKTGLRKRLPFQLRRWFVSLKRRTRATLLSVPTEHGQVMVTPNHARNSVVVSQSRPGVTPRPTYDVICFPLIDWEFRFQRPQQLLTQFASDGHRCYYLRTTFHQAGPSALQQLLAAKVENIQLPGPADLNLYTDAITEEALDGFIAALEEVREAEDIVDAICLVQLPFWVPLAQAVHERWGWKIVYDCMDEHAGFSTNGKAMLREEERLLRASDLVIATSNSLYEKCSQIAQQVLQLPNAADYDHFSQPGASRPLGQLNGPIIGYFGAISEWFDVELVCAAAASRPDWQFVLIGDTYGADAAPLHTFDNVHLLGEKPYAELPAYLHRFDVACIPFLRTPLTLATNPVKFYEYLSAGKPVVAIDLPELESCEEYYYPVRTAAEFVPQIGAALSEHSPTMVAERIRFARNNTWRQRYQSLGAAILQLYGKAAIVIVNHNNLDYLRMCLESVFARSVYPNYEVITVDNGSAPEVVAFLQATEADEPRLKVIYNDENLGFARANNVGIAAAGDCAYVVLLNSDTVVTRGWLHKLIRHLDDPAIALVGPLTNSIGNEARIEVDYDDLSEMEKFAQQYCRAHTGRVFDIPMLAMYCLAIRKSMQEKIGLLDERFGLGMFEDDDYSLRARRAGGRIVCAEDVFVHHWGGSFYGRLSPSDYDRLFNENRRKFEEKWSQKWQPHHYRAK